MVVSIMLTGITLFHLGIQDGVADRFYELEQDLPEIRLLLIL